MPPQNCIQTQWRDSPKAEQKNFPPSSFWSFWTYYHHPIRYPSFTSHQEIRVASSGGMERFFKASKVGVGIPQWSPLIRTTPSSSEKPMAEGRSSVIRVVQISPGACVKSTGSCWKKYWNWRHSTVGPIYLQCDFEDSGWKVHLALNRFPQYHRESYINFHVKSVKNGVWMWMGWMAIVCFFSNLYSTDYNEKKTWAQLRRCSDWTLFMEHTFKFFSLFAVLLASKSGSMIGTWNTDLWNNLQCTQSLHDIYRSDHFQ